MKMEIVKRTKMSKSNGPIVWQLNFWDEEVGASTELYLTDAELTILKNLLRTTEA